MRTLRRINKLIADAQRSPFAGVGISGGVKIYYLENFLRVPTENFVPPELTSNLDSKNI